MMRSVAAALLAVLAIIVAGCGGGGSSDGPNPPPPVTVSDTLIKGRVVGSQTGNPGVQNVRVTLGGTAVNAMTDASGNFTLNVAGVSSLPSYLSLDPSGAGSSYPPGLAVSYNSQKFLQSYILMSSAVLNRTADVGTITLTNVPEGDVPPPPDTYADADLVLTGQVIRSDTLTGIPGVTVTFGTPTITATTGTKGYFQLNLGRDTYVLARFTAPPYTFAINTSTAGVIYPTTLTLIYGSSSSVAQNAVPVPASVLSEETYDLGTIRVNMTGGGGGDDDDPPPPPL